jgi:parallel beta-helix repeat protein
MTSGAVCIRPIKAQSQSDITINADGSVTPSTAPIKQTGNIYTLTSDVDGTITVLRSNIIFNGNGQTITGKGVIGPGGLSIGCNFYAPTPIITGASNVTVENFTVTGSYYGISLWKTSNVTVAINTITRTGGPLGIDEGTAGIFVEGGGSNIITENNLLNNYDGISFGNTEDNLIVGNNITGSSNPLGASSYGLIFWESSNNTVYHNNFVNNTAQAGDADSINVWDAGYPLGGNYWNDYLTRYPNAVEIDGSGIGNASYVVDGLNTDRYPLLEPFNSTFGALQATSPKISLGSPLNQTYNSSSITLTFSVDVLSPVKAVNWTGYSLDGEPNVTVAGSSALTNVTLADVANGVHNVTVYANNTYGNMASETVNFTVAKPSPFPTIWVATAAVIAVAVGLGLLVYFKKRKRQPNTL